MVRVVGIRGLGSRADAYLTSGGGNVLAAVGGLGIVGVVVVVLIEHGGFGAVAAAPAARAIYQALFPHATKSGAHGA